MQSYSIKADEEVANINSNAPNSVSAAEVNVSATSPEKPGHRRVKVNLDLLRTVTDIKIMSPQSIPATSNSGSQEKNTSNPISPPNNTKSPTKTPYSQSSNLNKTPHSQHSKSGALSPTNILGVPTPTGINANQNNSPVSAQQKISSKNASTPHSAVAALIDEPVLTVFLETQELQGTNSSELSNKNIVLPDPNEDKNSTAIINAVVSCDSKSSVLAARASAPAITHYQEVTEIKIDEANTSPRARGFGKQRNSSVFTFEKAEKNKNSSIEQGKITDIKSLNNKYSSKPEEQKRDKEALPSIKNNNNTQIKNPRYNPAQQAIYKPNNNTVNTVSSQIPELKAFQSLPKIDEVKPTKKLIGTVNALHKNFKKLQNEIANSVAERQYPAAYAQKIFNHEASSFTLFSRYSAWLRGAPPLNVVLVKDTKLPALTREINSVDKLYN